MDKSIMIPCPKGFRVYITHIHDPEDLEFMASETHSGEYLAPPRYVTHAELFRLDPTTGRPLDKVAEAQARCSPRDVPCRKRGFLIAHNRVLIEFFGKALKKELVSKPSIPSIPEEQNDGVGLYI